MITPTDEIAVFSGVADQVKATADSIDEIGEPQFPFVQHFYSFLFSLDAGTVLDRIKLIFFTMH